MSYTVDVVAAVVPRDADVYAYRDELLDAKAGRRDASGAVFEHPSPEFVELHRRLTVKFPCICDDPDGPWSDGPLINNFGKEIATLGMSYSRVEEVLPFLVQVALAMGFSVIDGQDDKIYRPGRQPEKIRAAGETSERRPWWQFWK